MPDRSAYEFVVIRLVPRVEREEFLNVGVILFSKRKNYLAMRYKLDPERLHSLFPDFDLDQVRKHLEGWDAICKGHPDGGTIGAMEINYRFRWLAAPKSTLLQCSRPHPGLCDEPDKVLDRLFELFVL